jgi:hypothetical protein
MGKADIKNVLRRLYPELTEKQLAEIEKSLGDYLALALRVYERIDSDPAAHALLKALVAERKRKRDR